MEPVMCANAADQPMETIEQELVACQRRALLGALTSIIAHEYNNLMTPVIARAQFSLSLDDHAAMTKALTVTLEQTEKALHFTRKVLELAAGNPTEIETCVLREIVDGAVASSVRPLDKDGIELVIDVPDDLQVQAQPLLLEQLLLNLLLNARTAMKEVRGRMKISAAREADNVHIQVRDQGVGFAEELLRESINPFLAADAQSMPTAAGVGVGLYACRTIAHEHQARIWVENNPDVGCTFHVEWPSA